MLDFNNCTEIYGVEWVIPSTYYTKAITIERRCFPSRKERENYLIRRNKKWWEHLPFIQKMYWTN